MEALKTKENYNINKIKNLISTLIIRQIGDKLSKLEQKNRKEINDINIMSKTSKIIINNLSYFSTITKNNIYTHKASNLNNKMSKSKKNLLNKYNKKNQNLILRKSFTPLKRISKISKLSMQNNRLLRASTKSLDIVLKKNRSNKISNSFITKSINTKFKNKKSSKEIYKTPKRKNKNINKNCKTEERLYTSRNSLYNDLSLFDNDIEISINCDEDQRISNLKLSLYEKKNFQKEELSPERISLKLGPLIETIDNEKRIYFLGDNLFKKDFTSNHKKIKSKNHNCNNFFLIMIEYMFDYIYMFLDNKSLFNLLIANKDFFKLILRLIIAKLEKK